jgi:hypothetical protein
LNWYRSPLSFFKEVGFFDFIIWSINMKMVTAIIQPKRLSDVREALSEIEEATF